MQNKIQRLQPAVQVARSREDKAAGQLADFQRRLSEHQTRLQQLLSLRGEYAEQFQADGQIGLAARSLQDYMAFLGNLDRNIGQLQQYIQRLQEEFERKRRNWLASRAKTQALEGVIQRFRLEQSHHEARGEQLLIDEYASRYPRGMNKD